MYKIIGIYRGQKEEIDTATTKQEADYLVNEYRIAFGDAWIIYKKEGGE